MTHRTFRSLDAAPKLVLFTAKQWVALIADTAAVYGVVHVLHLAVKPAITLAVFAIGLPGALAYVSESGGLLLGLLLRDMLRWRATAKRLAPTTPGTARVRGLTIIASDVGECPVGEGQVGIGSMAPGGQPR